MMLLKDDNDSSNKIGDFNIFDNFFAYLLI